jgi:hypothetical protein
MYKVFLTHSSKNMDMVLSLGSMLKSANVEVYIAELNPEPGADLNEKIKRNLSDSDAVLVLLTDEGIRSDWVWREIKYAIQLSKMIIPLIEKAIVIPSLLKDIDCLIFDRNDYMAAYKLINERISALGARKIDLIAVKTQQNMMEIRNTDTALIILGVVAALFIVVAITVVASSK